MSAGTRGVRLVSERLIAGIDIGGTKTAVVLSRKPPEILDRRAFATRPEAGPEHALQGIVDTLRAMLAAEGSTPLDAIGISCGGPLDRVKGMIQQPPNLPTWIDIPIVEILARAFGTRCYLENDANAGALAERSFGAGKGAHSLVFLTMGTGIGAGLILNGELYRGSSDASGEIGHVRLTRSGPVGHNKAGSVEGWASGAGLAHLARSRISEAVMRGRHTMMASADEDLRKLTARDVAAAAEAGDKLAKQIIKMTGRRLGEAMAILIDLLNPECILVGGLALRLGEALLAPAREVVEREALAASVQSCRIVPAGLHEEIGDVAALCVAIEGEKDAREHGAF